MKSKVSESDGYPSDGGAYESIAENLAEASQREAERLEHFKTPTHKPKAEGDDRIFGLTPSYYLDLGGGKLPTVRVLMDDQGWDAAKADMALGMLKARGVEA